MAPVVYTELKGLTLFSEFSITIPVLLAPHHAPGIKIKGSRLELSVQLTPYLPPVAGGIGMRIMRERGSLAYGPLHSNRLEHSQQGFKGWVSLGRQGTIQRF